MIRNPNSLPVVAALTALLAGPMVQSQSPVDIGLYQREGHLEVTVRPQTSFDGIFSAVVFTIRWDASANASLGTPMQEGAVASYLPIARSGAVRQSSGNKYQVFAGFGLTPMSSLDAAWAAGQEYTIARIPVAGTADFELMNDDWTREAKNNGDFYLSLGGVDRTGIIYKGLASMDEGSVSIQPNPNNGQFTFSFTNSSAANTTVEVHNPVGQVIFTDAVLSFEGTYRRDMDIRSMASGVYFLKIKRGDVTSVHKIVRQ